MENKSSEEVVELYYFNGRGRAEQIRWMLAMVEVDYNFVPMDSRPKFEEMLGRREMLFDQLPLLKIDGLRLGKILKLCCVIILKPNSPVPVDNQTSCEEGRFDWEGQQGYGPD